MTSPIQPRRSIFDRPENRESPARLGKSGSRSIVLKKGNKKTEPKREFSEKVLKLISKMRFRVKLYIAMKRARQNIDEYNDSLNPDYKYLVKILRNQYRSNENAQRILECIRNFPFFAKFIKELGDVADTAVIQLCKHIKYEYIPAATCIFKEGDPSNDKFYVIIRGSVSIVKKVDKNVFQEENERNMKSGNSPLASPKDSEDLDSIKEKANGFDKELENLISKYGVKIKEMKEGEGFGEKALIEKNSKRTTSVITNSNCEFIVVLKNDYVNIIRKYDKRHQIKENFMKTKIPLLHTINSPVIWEDIFYLIKEIERPKGSILAHENEKGNKVFFIVAGYCELEKTVVIEQNSAHWEFDPLKIKKVIAKFNAGSCLGEEILLNTTQTYSYTIKVESTVADIYYVEREAFLKRFPPDSIRAIVQNFMLKEQVHMQKIKKIQDEAKESFFGKNNSQLNIKTNQILRCFNTPSRAKMSKYMQFSHNKEIESQERIPHLPIIEGADLDNDKEISYEQYGFVEVKNKLDSFLRNAVQAKPSTSQFPKLFDSAPRHLRDRTPTSKGSPSNSHYPKLTIESRTNSMSQKDEVSPISNNPEYNMKFKMAYKRIDSLEQSQQSVIQKLESTNKPPGTEHDLTLQKFDFGNAYMTKHIQRYKKLIAPQLKPKRSTSTEKILAVIQQTHYDKFAKDNSFEKEFEKVNYHVDDGFQKHKLKQKNKKSLSLNKKEIGKTFDGEKHPLKWHMQSEENLAKSFLNSRLHTGLKPKRSLASLQKHDKSIPSKYGLHDLLNTADPSTSQEVKKFVLAAIKSSNQDSRQSSLLKIRPKGV